MFNRKGELRHIHKLRYWPLVSVLREKYLLLPDVAEQLSSFLLPMLRLNPHERATAREALQHPWLDGVVTQGEIDLMLEAQMREELLHGTDNKSHEAMQAELARADLDVEDALKPVSLSASPVIGAGLPWHGYPHDSDLSTDMREAATRDTSDM